VRFGLIVTALALSLLAASTGPLRAGFDEGVAAYEREDFIAALQEFLPVAQNGDTVAQSYVGVMFHFGLGIKPDLEQAVDWYAKAANKGNALSQRILGDLHVEGAWGSPDYVTAAKWYELAAEGGDVEAQRKLGAMYLEGRGVPRDHNRAARWLRRASVHDSEARKMLRESTRPLRSPPRGSRARRAKGRRGGYDVALLRAPSSCEGGFPNAPYDINVKIIFPKPRIDHRHSIAELGRISGLGHNVRALGLMKPDLVIETRPHAQGLPMGDKFCFWITGFDVSLRYRRVDVFIAREYPVGSCQYKAILEHEGEHVRISRQNLEEFAPRVRRALSSLLIPTGQQPAKVVSAAAARRNVKGISDELLQPIYKQMMASLVRAQKDVDSSEEYARVQRKCKNW